MLFCCCSAAVLCCCVHDRWASTSRARRARFGSSMPSRTLPFSSPRQRRSHIQRACVYLCGHVRGSAERSIVLKCAWLHNGCCCACVQALTKPYSTPCLLLCVTDVMWSGRRLRLIFAITTNSLASTDTTPSKLVRHRPPCLYVCVCVSVSVCLCSLCTLLLACARPHCQCAPSR